LLPRAATGTGDHVFRELRLQLVEQAFLAAQKPCFKDRRSDRVIGLRKAHALVDRTRRMPNLQAQIPKQVQNELDDALAPRGLFERQQEKEIDVRSRR
jgi:hypothetical protein